MKSSVKQDKYISTVIENLKTPTIAQIKALELFLSTSSNKINPEEKDLIELTLNSCNDMQIMIENFTLLSKISSQKLSLDYSYFNLGKLIRRIIKNMSILLKYSGLEINYRVNEDIEVYADYQKIKKVIENIFSYIINSSCKNLKTEIHLNCYKNMTKFEIITNKASEDFKEVLQIFKQNQVNNPKYAGLFIAREIIKTHFGKSIFKTDEDNTIIGFYLPRR